MSPPGSGSSERLSDSLRDELDSFTSKKSTSVTGRNNGNKGLTGLSHRGYDRDGIVVALAPLIASQATPHPRRDVLRTSGMNVSAMIRRVACWTAVTLFVFAVAPLRAEEAAPFPTTPKPSATQLRATAEAAEKAGNWEAAFTAYCHLFVADRSAAWYS